MILARRIIKHKTRILAAIEHNLSNGLIESTNTNIRLITRIAFGFRFPAALIALALLSLGGHRPTLRAEIDPRMSQESQIDSGARHGVVHERHDGLGHDRILESAVTHRTVGFLGSRERQTRAPLGQKGLAAPGYGPVNVGQLADALVAAGLVSAPWDGAVFVPESLRTMAIPSPTATQPARTSTGVAAPAPSKKAVERRAVPTAPRCGTKKVEQESTLPSLRAKSSVDQIGASITPVVAGLPRSGRDG